MGSIHYRIRAYVERELNLTKRFSPWRRFHE